ncbi:C2h2 conidiation transcription factor [Mycena venus]|uniref:C2h2 conidiation transcription factor n=1 Tax=Mycena venus TaxID=2733690 RepID=A0A8H7D647_9AGAR|nr:C2h2 conidiation transcription factor [Mycena venus]
MEHQGSYPPQTVLMLFFSNAHPCSVSADSALAHRPTTTFNFLPHFPEESIERYPCLTHALADSYPGPRNFFTNDAAIMSNLISGTCEDPSGDNFYPGLSTTSRYDWPNLNFMPILGRDRDVEDLQGPLRNPLPDSATPYADSSLKEKKKSTSHSCSICGQFFRRLGTLAVHLKRHQGPPDPIHKCEICGRPFVRPTALQKHLKRHQEEGFSRKPHPRHKCNVCDKEFLRSADWPPFIVRPSALETHLNMHYNRQPFKCPIMECQKMFSARSNAVRHMHMHGGSQAPVVVSASAPNDM